MLIHIFILLQVLKASRAMVPWSSAARGAILGHGACRRERHKGTDHHKLRENAANQCVHPSPCARVMALAGPLLLIPFIDKKWQEKDTINKYVNTCVQIYEYK